MMKSMLVIGLGQFGSHLAQQLTGMGNAVTVADKDERRVAGLLHGVSSGKVADCTDETFIKSLGIHAFDVCFVCIGGKVEVSLEITVLLKENGAKFIVAQAERDAHAKLLMYCGADDMIVPDTEMAQRTAMKYGSRQAVDYLELGPDFGIYEIETPAGWVGKTVREMTVRSRYSINIIALKSNGRVVPMNSAAHIFSEKERLIIAGDKKGKMRLLEKNDKEKCEKDKCEKDRCDKEK